MTVTSPMDWRGSRTASPRDQVLVLDAVIANLEGRPLRRARPQPDQEATEGSQEDPGAHLPVPAPEGHHGDDDEEGAGGGGDDAGGQVVPGRGPEGPSALTVTRRRHVLQSAPAGSGAPSSPGNGGDPAAGR